MEDEILRMLENKCSSGYIVQKTGWTQYKILKLAKQNNIDINKTLETYNQAKKLINQGCDEFDICYELGITLEYIRYIADNVTKHKWRTSRANRGKVYEREKGDAREYINWVGPIPELTEEEKKQSETDYWEFHKDRNFTANNESWEGVKK